MVSFMPVSWGTRDSKVLTKASAAIDDVEWKLLNKNIARSEKVRGASGQFVLLDSGGSPRRTALTRSELQRWD